MKRFATHWLPLIGFCILIFIESSQPLPDLAPDIPMLDKALHLIAWAVLGFLFYRAYAGSDFFIHALTNRLEKNPLLWISFVSAALYGVSDEIHQYFVPFRSADLMDILADIIGSFIGAIGGAKWHRIFHKSSSVFSRFKQRASVD